MSFIDFCKSFLLGALPGILVAVLAYITAEIIDKIFFRY